MKHITIAGDTVRVIDHNGHQFIPIDDVCKALHKEKDHQLRRVVPRLHGAVVIVTLKFPAHNGWNRDHKCVRIDTLRAWVLSMTSHGKATEAVTRWKMALAKDAPPEPTDETFALQAQISALKAELLDLYRELHRLQKGGDHV